MSLRNYIVTSVLAMATIFASSNAFASCASAARWAAANASSINSQTGSNVIEKEAGAKYLVTLGVGTDHKETYVVYFSEGSCDPREARVVKVNPFK